MSTTPLHQAAAAPFEIAGPLPTGITVLEASAGTGKTYAIAALAATYVAEGTPLERILLVTFTRMATGELRERVRERLVSAERGLSQVLGGETVHGDDVVELLAAGPREVIDTRRDRLAGALADFDAATIATIHGFCQEVIGGLGIAADLAPDATFVEDVSDLVEEVVDDLYVRRFYRDAAPGLRRADALAIARFAIERPGAPIVPASGEIPEMRVRLARRARAELEARKRRAGLMTYDDLLSTLDDALGGPGGDAVAAKLRERYKVVLVDEFQDTDPVQWSIMRRAFGGHGRTLVLIADPKQAIYAFRGADVHAYLEAALEAATTETLIVNWRSDQRLLDAYDALFGNARLGGEGIVYRRTRAAPGHRAPAMHGAPLRIRVVPRESVQLTNRGFASAVAAREHIAKDLAGDLVAVLSESEHVRPGDVAALVRTNWEVKLVREALEAVAIPAVTSGAGSVFATDIAREWLRLLEALERPASGSRAHSAALTAFIGWAPPRVAAAGEDDWEELHRRLHDWGRILRAGGVASLVETIARMEGLARRVLARRDGERRLTDLRHIGQLLHQAHSSEGLGATTLTAWLRRRIVEAGSDIGDEDRTRRLESDAEAVQVLTIHRSKGLEFPIVYVPFLWDAPRAWRDEPVPVSFHDPERGNQRCLDVALDGPDFKRHQELSVAEQRGEDLRLAYVALTRAQHQAAIWWAGSYGSRNSPLGRLVFFRDADGTVASAGRCTPDDDHAIARFEDVAREAPGCISVERSTLGLPTTWGTTLTEPAPLSAAVFGRSLDRRWRRSSYSDITAAAHDARVASEPEEPVVSDEPASEVVPAVAPARGAEPGGAAARARGVDPAGAAAPARHPDPAAAAESTRHPDPAAAAESAQAADPAAAIASPLESMPAGVEVGTFVHRLLETTEFDSVDLDGELALRSEAILATRKVELGDRPAILGGIRAAIETPLGAVTDGRPLRDFARADRLDELVFELPVAGGERPVGWLTLGAIAEVLRAWLPPADPLAGYPDRLGDPALRQSFRGYLTGTLDLVVRFGGRFAVLDYKTNWLAAPDQPLTVWHYRPEGLHDEMFRRHYALQALLYVVALHRYLRWRVPGYSPERDLAGVGYLFLRGMTGADTPVVDGGRCGVFGWRPPAGLVQALSDTLDRGTPA